MDYYLEPFPVDSCPSLAIVIVQTLSMNTALTRHIPEISQRKGRHKEGPGSSFELIPRSAIVLSPGRTSSLRTGRSRDLVWHDIPRPTPSGAAAWRLTSGAPLFPFHFYSPSGSPFAEHCLHPDSSACSIAGNGKNCSLETRQNCQSLVKSPVNVKSPAEARVRIAGH